MLGMGPPPKQLPGNICPSPLRCEGSLLAVWAAGRLTPVSQEVNLKEFGQQQVLGRGPAAVRCVVLQHRCCDNLPQFTQGHWAPTMLYAVVHDDGQACLGNNLC